MRAKKTTEKTYELKYNGWLFEKEAPVYLHYGLSNWSEISESKMRKLKKCYKTEITVPADITSLSFCFRDTEGNWDNNGGNDYWYTPAIGETYSCVSISPVETKPVATKATTTKKAVKKDK